MAPEEEYFRLSVLSLKMTYQEIDKDFVFMISSKRLFQECQAANIPFHKWYKWIDEKLVAIDRLENPFSKHSVDSKGVYKMAYYGDKHMEQPITTSKQVAQPGRPSAALTRSYTHGELPKPKAAEQSQS